MKRSFTLLSSRFNLTYLKDNLASDYKKLMGKEKGIIEKFEKLNKKQELLENEYNELKADLEGKSQDEQVALLLTRGIHWHPDRISLDKFLAQEDPLPDIQEERKSLCKSCLIDWDPKKGESLDRILDRTRFKRYKFMKIAEFLRENEITLGLTDYSEDRVFQGLKEAITKAQKEEYLTELGIIQPDEIEEMPNPKVGQITPKAVAIALERAGVLKAV